MRGALAAARMGLETVVFTVSVDSIAMMPCNPNIGGTSKGHLVKEIDALGGEMGKNIDKTFIQRSVRWRLRADCGRRCSDGRKPFPARFTTVRLPFSVPAFI